MILFMSKNILKMQKGMLQNYTIMFFYSLNVLKAILKSVVASVHLSVWSHIFIGIPHVEFIQIIFCESIIKLIILPMKNAL
jgi:hypothetical protein